MVWRVQAGPHEGSHTPLAAAPRDSHTSQGPGRSAAAAGKPVARYSHTAAHARSSYTLSLTNAAQR